MTVTATVYELCLLITLAGTSLAWTGSDSTGLAFQAENQLTPDSHASLQLLSPPPPSPTPETPPYLSDLSVCLWFKVFHFRETSSYLFSYATTDKDNNELNLGVTSEQVLIAVGGRYIFGRVDGDKKFLPDSWYHVCFVSHSTNETGTLFVNGKVLQESRLSPRNILLNGTLALGQESDKVGGGYVAEQSFSGIVTAFNLYSRALSEEEVRDLARCGGRGAGPEGDLVSWSSANWTLAGPVAQQDLPPQYCTPTNRFLVFTQQRPHDLQEEFCQNLKLSVAVPHSVEENARLYESAFPFKDQCQPHNHASAFFLLGAVGTPKREEWFDFEGRRLNYTNFESLTRFTSKRCVGLLVPPAAGTWTDMSCKKTVKFCAACYERRLTVLRMRGLCEQVLEATFFRIEQEIGKVASLRGFVKYYISRDDNTTWSLLNMWTGDVFATTLVHDLDLPLGRRQWRVATSFTLCDLPEGHMHTLSLSACQETEFACGDGTCIHLHQRCDMRVDCPDNTDEKGCDKLVVPDEYLEDLPPPALTPGPLALSLAVSLQGFSEVDIVNMKMTVDFWTVITWYDQRLTYKNLKNFSDLNYLKDDSVWTPVVNLVNADFPETYTTDAILTVLRQSQPEPDDVTRPQHDEMFEGAKNPIQRRQKVSAPFSCNMDLRDFPFDSQRCHLHLRLSSANQEFLVWQNLTVEYLGEVLLTEYEVDAVTGEVGQGGGYSQFTVTINFQRRYSYYFTSAYLPIVMLMFISYASLYCPRDNMDLRVMMALTTLLVLFALYQQISDTLPRTSYVKAIDVWCFFAITFIFSQVVLHVAIDVHLPCFRRIRLSISSSSSSSSTITTKVKNLDSKRRSGRVLVAARVLYALVWLVFCFAYWGILLSQ